MPKQKITSSNDKEKKTTSAENSKTRADVLEFLETLHIDETEQDLENASDNENTGDVSAKDVEDTKASASESTDKNDKSKSSGASALGAAKGNPIKRTDSTNVLQFIDEITRVAQQAANPAEDSHTKEKKQQLDQDEKKSHLASDAQPSAWSWGGLWGQATSTLLSEENQSSIQSSLSKIKGTIISNVKNLEPATSSTTKLVEANIKNLVNSAPIKSLASDLQRGFETVIDTIAPQPPARIPITFRYIDNLNLSSNKKDAAYDDDNSEPGEDDSALMVSRILAELLAFHASASESTNNPYYYDLTFSPVINASTIDKFKGFIAKRSDTFGLPKSFDSAYEAAFSAIKVASELDGTTESPASSEPTSSSASSVYLCAQPFQFALSNHNVYLAICLVLFVPATQITLHTFSQFLPISIWANPLENNPKLTSDSTPRPKDMPTTTSTSASTSASTSTSDSSSKVNIYSSTGNIVAIYEECITEALMLGVKTLINQYISECS
ncbi:hypothetical protein AX774_g1862 [Zancudomyces culisetae]|uniref:Maintenance of telomere capping protein 1 n=1 Tax=Zancudomyces culisetae TaxID=1213189 RepID=A0A1R1PUM4_ZANCU|nr:hypothetical protein AX774_g1862 [Zancudomyces culisetae]|eukprot:OMH84613.1 hypothetical protein AX774_g1862 [Zancudomyces culisetae]